MKRCVLVIVLLSLGTVSCTSLQLQPTDRSEGAGPELPRKFAISEGGTKGVSETPWWQSVAGDEAARLVDAAREGNLGLEAIRARLRQVHASAVQRRAGQLPSLDLDADASATRNSEPSTTTGSRTSESYSLGLAASFELDLWGRVSAQARASDALVGAAADDVATAELSLSAEIVGRYLELVAARAKLDLLAAQLSANRDVLALIETRFRSGRATALDVLQQREVVARTEALVPSQQAREAILLHELATLTGEPAGTDMGLQARTLPAVKTLPGTGVPADLLAARPDVRAAWNRLRSADWEQTVARADRLPSLLLSGSVAYSSDDIAELFDEWLARLAGSLTGPLFDRGRRRAEVTRTQAVADERLAAYRETVLEAFREVQDALVLDMHQVDTIAAVERQLAAARLSAREAGRRYRKGAESYLSVLSAQISVQNLERTLVDSQLQRAAYRVQLHRALGGEPLLANKHPEGGIER